MKKILLLTTSSKFPNFESILRSYNEQIDIELFRLIGNLDTKEIIDCCNQVDSVFVDITGLHNITIKVIATLVVIELEKLCTIVENITLVTSNKELEAQLLVVKHEGVINYGSNNDLLRLLKVHIDKTIVIKNNS